MAATVKTATVTKQIKAGGTTIKRNVQHTGNSEIHFEEQIASSQTDLEFTMAIDNSKLQVFWIQSDVALTVETNSGSVPQETLTLLPGKPQTFELGDTAIFAGDVAAIFVTSTTTALLEIYCLMSG